MLHEKIPKTVQRIHEKEREIYGSLGQLISDIILQFQFSIQGQEFFQFLSAAILYELY